jgi:hypothetical protein
MAKLELFINERGPYLGELNVETERIDITSGLTTYKPDPQWTHVDKAGHFHAIAEGGKFPTLEAYTKTSPCPGGCGDPGCEGTTEVRYRCRICRKRVKPGRVLDQAGGERRTMPGLTTWTVRIDHREALGDDAADVSIRAVAGERTLFGVARRHMTARNSDGYTYEFHGVTELGRRP